MDTLLIALLATALGASLVALWSHARQATLRERLRQYQSENERLQTELASARGELATMQTARAALQVELATERAGAAEKIKALTEAQARLTTEFQALSAQALQNNNRSFLELAQATLAQFQQKAENDLASRQQAIDVLIKPLHTSLEKVDTKINELEQARARAYGQLGQQLESLGSAQLRLHSEATRLSTALRSTTYAGSWGELQLRRVVELADMLPYADFSEQETAGALRADLVVRLPGGQRIVIDAKTPLQSYREALDASDEAERSRRLAEHAQKLRAHTDTLASKNYWEQFQPSPEFVVLFVPGDHFLAAALQADPALLERAIQRKVLLASPLTLIALLKAAAYGWRQESLSRHAEEVSRLGRDLYDRTAVFADHLEKVGRGLDAAVKGYNAAVGSFETSLLPGGRKFVELGAKGSKDLDPPPGVETGVRSVLKRA